MRKICEYAANEDEVRELLDRIWAEPERAEDIIAEVREKNKGIFDFEKRLQEKAGATREVWPYRHIPYVHTANLG